MVDFDDPELIVRFFKPHAVLTAFTDKEGRETLADYIPIPEIYTAGRLDRDSEGLLILTRSKRLRELLMDPRFGHPRSYLVQVEGIPTTEAVDMLEAGVELKDGMTRPAKATVLDTPPDLPPRRVPIRVRKSIPDTWMRIQLTEGRNRQVRRMTAAVGYPTLRIVREAIGPTTIAGLEPGDWRVLDPSEATDLWSSVRETAATSRPGRGRPPRGRRSPD